MNLFADRPQTEAPRFAQSRTARSGTPSSSNAPAPLTFEEWMYLVPSAAPTSPEEVAALMPYRHEVMPWLPQFTAVVMRAAPKLKRKGFAIPARFLPGGEPTKEEVIGAAVTLYRQFLNERYSSG